MIGLNLFGTGFLIKPTGNDVGMLITFYIVPTHYCYEGIIMSHFKDMTQRVITVVGSAYYDSLNCTTENPNDCFGTMKSYANFAFGSRFSYDNMLMDILVPISYLIVAMSATHWALGHLSYGNT